MNRHFLIASESLEQFPEPGYGRRYGQGYGQGYGQRYGRAYAQGQGQNENYFEADFEDYESEIDRGSTDYIRWVQKSLNWLTGKPLSETGVVDAPTKALVRTFQSQMYLKSDGIVGERTERALIRSTGTNPPGIPGSPTESFLYPEVISPLPRLGLGFYSYKPSAATQFGLPQTILALMTIGIQLYGRHPNGPRIGIGDISLRGGGDIGGHKSHEQGVDIDILPMRNDGKDGRVTWNGKDKHLYSRALTQELVDLIRSNGILRVGCIFFNDPSVKGVQYQDNHDNHLHIRFCAPSVSKCTCKQTKRTAKELELDEYRDFEFDSEGPSYGTAPFGESEFSLFTFPEAIIGMLRSGLEPTAIRLAMTFGYRDENQLTDLVFHSRHPERLGRGISASESGYSSLVREWISIRDSLVRPALSGASAPSSPSGYQSSPTAQPPSSLPSTSTGGLDIVRVRGIQVARQIASNFENLLAAAEADGIKLGGGGYRSPAQQIELRRKHCGPTQFDIYEKKSSLCKPPTARPGQSNHEKGLAIDFTYNGKSISSQSSPAFQWLAKNAARFGFYNLPSEPWHWSINGK